MAFLTDSGCLIGSILTGCKHILSFRGKFSQRTSFTFRSAFKEPRKVVMKLADMVNLMQPMPQESKLADDITRAFSKSPVQRHRSCGATFISTHAARTTTNTFLWYRQRHVARPAAERLHQELPP